MSLSTEITTSSTETTSTSTSTETTSSTIESTPPTPKPSINELTTQLFTACTNSDEILMQSLLEQGANPNHYRNLSDHYIPTKSWCLNAYSAKGICKSSIDPNNTLLDAAVLSNKIEMVDFVVKLCGTTCINTTDLCSHGELSIATLKGYDTIVKHLISTYNAPIEFKLIHHTDSSINLFDCAVYSGNIELMKYIYSILSNPKPMNINIWQYVCSTKCPKQGLSMVQLLFEEYSMKVNNVMDVLCGNSCEIIDYVVQTNPTLTLNTNHVMLYAAANCSYEVIKHLIGLPN